MASKKRILIITTNVGRIDDEHQTGVWLEEFAVPYLEFKKEGYDIIVASPLGGKTPIDPKSTLEKYPEEWDSVKNILDNTKKLSEVDYTDFDAVFIPGGHGPMFDLAQDYTVAEAVNYFNDRDKVVAAVCHGPAGLLLAENPDGTPVFQGKKITCFTNLEEKMADMDKVVPFMLQGRIEELGGEFEEAKPYSEHVVQDENLITGQNQNSAFLIAQTIIESLNK